MGSLSKIAVWLRRRAENVAAALLATVFISFILQIIFRYVLNRPVGWTLEVSTLAWMWLVLWGAAFVVAEHDEVRFDILYSASSESCRRGFVVVTSTVMAGLFAISFPAVVDYVTFMRREHASYIDLRLDYVFSVYLIFALAGIVRYLWLGWMAIIGEVPDLNDPSHLRDE